MSIDVICFTNLDSHRHREWPKSLAIAPVVGHFVEAADGTRLRIVSITHYTTTQRAEYSMTSYPCLKVELHN